MDCMQKQALFRPAAGGRAVSETEAPNLLVDLL
jgi:hypothetical protein